MQDGGRRRLIYEFEGRPFRAGFLIGVPPSSGKWLDNLDGNLGTNPRVGAATIAVSGTRMDFAHRLAR